MSLIEQTEAALGSAGTGGGAAESEALAIVDLFDAAGSRLEAATTTLRRVLGALAVLQGLSPVHSAGLSINPEQAVIVDKPKPPRRKAAPQGAECPGCGDRGTITRQDNYKGKPYSVMQCGACQWQRNV